MTRSKLFSEHQEERKQELLKEHGCYILKDIKGDITVNNPENYSIEYKKYDGSIFTLSIPTIVSVVESRDKHIKTKDNELEKMLIICKCRDKDIKELSESIKDKDEKIFKLEADAVSGKFVIDKLEKDVKEQLKMKDIYRVERDKCLPIVSAVGIIKKDGNIFQKLLLKILGL